MEIIGRADIEEEGERIPSGIHWGRHWALGGNYCSIRIPIPFTDRWDDDYISRRLKLGRVWLMLLCRPGRVSRYVSWRPNDIQACKPQAKRASLAPPIKTDQEAQRRTNRLYRQRLDNLVATSPPWA